MDQREPGDAQNASDHEASPLDDPLNSTYVRVLIIEVVVIVLLFVLGRIFQ